MSDTITCAQLVARVQRRVAGARNATLNRLSNAVAATIDEIEVDFDPGPIATQTYVSIGDEMMFVWEVNRGGKTLTVERGVSGTEAVAHTAGAIVEVGARFPAAVIKDTIQDEIRSWPEDVFRVKTLGLTGATAQGAYDLGVREADLRFVMSVNRSPATTFRGSDRWTRVPFTVARGMDRETFPSGVALFLTERFREAHTISVVAAVGFDVDDINDADDVVEDWGLSRSMVDIVSLGAAARLLQDAEAVRTDTESLGESRIAAEVPPTYLTNTATALRRLADKRIRDEAMRLRSRWPMPS